MLHKAIKPSGSRKTGSVWLLEHPRTPAYDDGKEDVHFLFVECRPGMGNVTPLKKFFYDISRKRPLGVAPSCLRTNGGAVPAFPVPIPGNFSD